MRSEGGTGSIDDVCGCVGGNRSVIGAEEVNGEGLRNGIQTLIILRDIANGDGLRLAIFEVVVSAISRIEGEGAVCIERESRDD